MSCTKPFTSFLYSSFIGTTYLPSLMVIIESIINLDLECTKSNNLSFKRCSKTYRFFLKLLKVGEALSAIVFSSIILLVMLVTILLLTYKDENISSNSGKDLLPLEVLELKYSFKS